jgi:uncharacterized membrane protein (DUF2068 family)
VNPTGIKLIAVLHWLRALVYATGALAILGVAHLSSRMISAVANDTPFGRLTSGVGNVLGVIALTIALFWVILGIGIWTMKNWARIATLIAAGLYLIYGLMSIARYPTAWHLLRVAVEIAIVVYLMLPEVKRAFGA